MSDSIVLYEEKRKSLLTQTSAVLFWLSWTVGLGARVHTHRMEKLARVRTKWKSLRDYEQKGKACEGTYRMETYAPGLLQQKYARML
jgi:hypothetical protein